MIALSSFPKNRDKFVKLLKFLEEILDFCEAINVLPILDGSLAVFLYTKDINIAVNDIDLCYSEKYFSKIKKALMSNGFKIEIKEWHVLQVRRADLKIEFGDTDYWYPGVPIESDESVQIGKHQVPILKLDSLMAFYQIGLRNLEKDFPDKQEKYLNIKGKYELLKKLKMYNQIYE